MKKQMVMAVMILMFLAEGCSGHTEGSVEKAEPVTGCSGQAFLESFRS